MNATKDVTTSARVLCHSSRPSLGGPMSALITQREFELRLRGRVYDNQRALLPARTSTDHTAALLGIESQPNLVGPNGPISQLFAQRELPPRLARRPYKTLADFSKQKLVLPGKTAPTDTLTCHPKSTSQLIHDHAKGLKLDVCTHRRSQSRRIAGGPHGAVKTKFCDCELSLTGCTSASFSKSPVSSACEPGYLREHLCGMDKIPVACKTTHIPHFSMEATSFDTAAGMPEVHSATFELCPSMKRNHSPTGRQHYERASKRARNVESDDHGGPIAVSVSARTTTRSKPNGSFAKDQCMSFPAALSSSNSREAFMELAPPHHTKVYRKGTGDQRRGSRGRLSSSLYCPTLESVQDLTQAPTGPSAKPICTLDMTGDGKTRPTAPAHIVPEETNPFTAAIQLSSSSQSNGIASAPSQIVRHVSGSLDSAVLHQQRRQQQSTLLVDRKSFNERVIQDVQKMWARQDDEAHQFSARGIKRLFQAW